MADWSGIDLGGDLDLNIDYGEAPVKVRQSTKTSANEAMTSKQEHRKLDRKRPIVASKQKEQFVSKKAAFEFVKKRPQSIDNVTALKITAAKEPSPTSTTVLTDPTSSSSSTAMPPAAPVLFGAHKLSYTQPEKREVKKVIMPASDDPNQYHSKPAELSANALKRPRSILPTSSSVFSSATFSSMQLEQRLVDMLEQPTADGGLGFTAATNVQSAVIPLLSNRANMLIRSQTGSGQSSLL